MKIGSGLYARARRSALDGTPTPTKGLRALADEALRRLGIKPAPTRLEQDYSAGKTTQVPSGRRVAVNRRVRRKIGYNGVVLSFERARPRFSEDVDFKVAMSEAPTPSQARARRSAFRHKVLSDVVHGMQIMGTNVNTMGRPHYYPALA